jgi:CBS domain-containing protein
MRVRDVMTTDPMCCTPATPLDRVAKIMAERDCGAVPVVGDLATKMPLGIITDRDIVVRALAAGHNPVDMTAGDCMTMPVATIPEDAPFDDCVDLLQIGQIRRAIVVNKRGAVVGIVAQADIAFHTSKRDAGKLLRKVSQPSVPALAANP